MLSLAVVFMFCNAISVLGDLGDIPQSNMELVGAAVPADEGSSRRVEEFFWTGSGDGPPAPPEPPRASPPAAGDAVLVRTTTVLATLYLDNSQPPQAVTDRTSGECILNCGEAGFPDSLQPAAVPGDQRYWLLTVVRGGTPDALQLRLARLYQKAFLRSVRPAQQERHLGIVKSLDAPTTRKKHDVHSFEVDRSKKGNPHRHHNIQSSMAASPDLNSKVPDNTPYLNITSSSSITSSSIAPSFTQFSINMSEPETVAKIVATKLSEVEDMWILATPDAALVKREVVFDQGDINDEEYSENMLELPLEEEANTTSGVFKREIIKPEQQPPVQVYIQNVTESPETQNVEIVYVVLVGGRAVPAAVAARDMRLVRDAEVAFELGYPVTTKAEPYLKAAESLEGGGGGGARGGEVWALVGGALAAAVLLLLLLALLCRLARRKKTLSAAALHSYRSELLREAERNQLKQVHEEKDGRLVSVVSPSRTRPSSAVLPRHRADTASSSSTSSGVSEVAAALRRRQRRGQRAAQRGALRLPHKRVGTTDSLLASAGLSESSSADSARVPSAPPTPTSYLSMPSVKSFPRGNAVEPLARVLEPVSVRHLDLDSPPPTPRAPAAAPAAPRRRMAAQLVRLGSMDRDPGVVGPLVWDLHCQRVREMPTSAESGGGAGSRGAAAAAAAAAGVREGGNISRMRQRFNELVDDAFSLFGSAAASPDGEREADDLGGKDPAGTTEIAQARNNNVRLPGSPYTALDTVRGRSANVRPTTSSIAFGPQPTPEGGGGGRPRTSLPRRPALERRAPPARAWDTPSPQMVSMGAVPRQPVVNPHIVLAEGRLPPSDPALPLISAIKSEIQRVRDVNMPY